MIPSCREFISHGIVKYLFTYGLEFLGMIMFFERKHPTPILAV